MSNDSPKCDSSSPEVSSHCLTQDERGRILTRIHSTLYWVGQFIPDEYEIDGQKIRLRDTIMRFIMDDDVTEEERASALALADRLQEEARRLESLIKSQDISIGNAHVLLDDVCGLLRAVDDLRNLDKEQADYSKHALMEKVSDEKRWMQFVKKIQ
jgi:hypothetical protein